jgi:hypothetical protein
MMGPQTDMEAIKADWEVYQAAVAAIEIGDGETYREVNQRLGYPLAKSLPKLMVLLKRAEADRDNYKGYLDKMKSKLAETNQEVKQLKALMEKERKEENAAAALKKGAKKNGDTQS